ncbi:9148_t:CDS:2 [Ambispora gerdemannii]|uniref:Phosphotransferase n=1 Tax=Ambispora gerdemannii TaxID=144530 RepID=A0A9N8UY54_9GLOM|nr:9148_t:CDS:2 [Ambispora gerdemannii]
MATTALDPFKLIDIENATEEQALVLEDITKQFELSTQKITEIVQHYVGEMHKGLEKNNHTLAMIPSFVIGKPTGKEVGTVLAMDLGGTNFRVCLMEFKENTEINIKQQKYRVPDEFKTGKVNMLFDYIADCVDKFLQEIGYEKKNGILDLGFTFSFPVQQTAIDKGTLLHWTKGFEAEGAVGEDIVKLMQGSLNRRQIPARVVALINDTVGTLLAHAYKRHTDALIGVILGTGTNGAYFEKISHIKKLGTFQSKSEEMIVNMEWGAFDLERKILPITMFDNKLDRESLNPRAQLFEKLISGMYLGEIVRNIILYLIDRDLLFKCVHFDYSTFKEINKQWAFDTVWVSTIEADQSSNLDDTKIVFEKYLNIYSTSLTDRQIVKKVCQIVGIRSARLGAAGLAGVISHRGAIKTGCSIGIDGSLFEFYPNFEQRLKSTFHEVFGSDAENIHLELTRDGSGVGAALAAILAVKHA